MCGFEPPDTLGRPSIARLSEELSILNQETATMKITNAKSASVNNNAQSKVSKPADVSPHCLPQ
jgi:hypothetical protein